MVGKTIKDVTQPVIVLCIDFPVVDCWWMFRA